MICAIRHSTPVLTNPVPYTCPMLRQVGAAHPVLDDGADGSRALGAFLASWSKISSGRFWHSHQTDISRYRLSHPIHIWLHLGCT